MQCSQCVLCMNNQSHVQKCIAFMFSVKRDSVCSVVMTSLAFLTYPKTCWNWCQLLVQGVANVDFLHKTSAALDLHTSVPKIKNITDVEGGFLFSPRFCWSSVHAACYCYERVFFSSRVLSGGALCCPLVHKVVPWDRPRGHQNTKN